MNVLHLIEEADREVPASAPPGTRWEARADVTTPHGRHAVSVAVCVDPDGRRHEWFWFEDVRVERHVLLRLTCAEAECPHAVAVRAQWLAERGQAPTDTRFQGPRPQPLMTEVAFAVGRHQVVARPARFPCLTPCPHRAHPPLRIDKSGFDLFEDGICLGGGVTKRGGVLQPRIPTVGAAEAFVLARHLETLVTIGKAVESSRSERGSSDERG